MTSTITSTPADELVGPRPQHNQFAFVPCLAYAVATLVALSLPSATLGLTCLSILSCVIAVSVAIRKGGSFLLPSSVFFLASGVFIGGAGYYLSFVDTPVDPEVLRDAAGLALLTTIGILTVVTAFTIHWQLAWPTAATVRHASLRRPPTHFALKAGFLVALSQVPAIETAVGPVASSAGMGGLLMLVLWASSRTRDLRWYGDIVVVFLAFALPVAWVELTFRGGGRLLIAGIGVASFLGWNLLNPNRFQKLLLILMIPLFLGFAGLNRVAAGDDSDETAQTSASSVVTGGDGLASVYSPLETWTRMLQPLTRFEQQKLGPRYGGTFVNTFVLPVPRTLWPDKPKGFGAELTEAFEPQLVKSDHSMAGLLHGEWYANFGFGGLVLMIPVTGWFLALLDRRHAILASGGFETSRAWWSATIVMCFTASLGELFWVGTFSTYARGGLAALAVFMVGSLSLTRRIDVIEVVGSGPPVPQGVRVLDVAPLPRHHPNPDAGEPR